MGFDMNQGRDQKPRYSGQYSGHGMQQFTSELSQHDKESVADTTQSVPQCSVQDMEPFRELSQNECKSEPEDPMDFRIAYGNTGRGLDYDRHRYIDYSLCELSPLHPDVDLALDNNYADDSQFEPCDSNVYSTTPSEMTNTYVEPTYTPPTPSSPEPVYITTSSGTIKLTPSPRFHTSSYYDDLSYNPESTDYKFTTASQLLDPGAFDIIGWSPEHYAGLTNPIPVPASAYTPRPKPSPSDPIRRTVLTSNRDLALMVGWMRKRITVMHQQGTGLVHPDFPTTWGGVALLTEGQLDSLAEFYHQKAWSEWRLLYPCPMFWRREDSVWVKRRKMMEFIGMRKPVPPPVEVVRWLDELEDEIERRIAEEREREERREELRRKMWFCSEG